jgi:hypothetical protein
LQGAPAIADQKEVTAGTDKEIFVPQQNNTPSAAVSEKKAAIIKEKPEAPAPAAVAVPQKQQTGNREGSIRLSSGEMRQLIRSGRQELENVR